MSKTQGSKHNTSSFSAKMKIRNIILLTSLLLFGRCLSQDSLQYLTLSAARSYALEHNESLRKAENELLKSCYDRRAAFRSALPTVDASAGVLFMGDQDMMGYTLQMKGTYLAGFTLTQPLYTGGKITIGNRLAKLGMQCSEEQLRQVKQQLIADVDNAYYTWVAVREKVKLLQVYRTQMDSLYSMVEATVNANMATNNDLLRIGAKRSELIYQQQKVQNGEHLCMLALAAHMGLNTLPQGAMPVDTVINAGSASALNSDISQRPEIVLLNKNVEVMHQQVKMQIADYLPTLALTAGYTWYGNIKMKGTTMLPDGTPYPFTQSMKASVPLAGIVLKLPILDWGVNFQKIRKAKLDEQNAQLDLQQNTRLLTIEAEQAMHNLNTGYMLVESAKAAREQADENLRVTTERYNNAMCPLTDLLDAQSQWQQARSNEIEALTQLKIHQTEYLRTRGLLF